MCQPCLVAAAVASPPNAVIRPRRLSIHLHDEDDDADDDDDEDEDEDEDEDDEDDEDEDEDDEDEDESDDDEDVVDTSKPKKMGPGAKGGAPGPDGEQAECKQQ